MTTIISNNQGFNHKCQFLYVLWVRFQTKIAGYALELKEYFLKFNIGFAFGIYWTNFRWVRVWAFRENLWGPLPKKNWEADSSIEFEAQWDAILKKERFGNEWMIEIYNIHREWAPTYHKQYFWSRMSSNQRSEWTNALLKMHVSRKSSVQDFVINFERALETENKSS